jgi:hypothetical protein
MSVPSTSGATDLLSVSLPADQAPEAPIGDAQDSGGAAVAHMVSADHDAGPRSAQGVATDVHERDIALPALENLTTPQRRKALADEMTALHQAGRWNAVVAAARELARIDPDNSDPGGILSDAQAKICEAELAYRYAQAIDHLDEGQWQQAAGLLAGIEQEQPGYRDAAALLETAQLKLRETAAVPQRATPPAWPIPETTTAAPPGTATPPDSVPVQRRLQTSSWVVAAVFLVFCAVALAGCLIILDVVQRQSSDTSTSTATSTPTATTSVPPAFAPASGPNETIGDYIKKNNIEQTTITHQTPAAPKIDLPVPVGWTGIPEGADAPYGGIVFNTPTDPKDPPKIVAIVAKLTGDVDTDKLLAVAAGEVKNLPGYDGGDGQKSTLSGYPAYQIAGSYTKNGVTRRVAQKTVVIQSKNGVYVLQLKAEGPQADADALNDVTGVIDQTTTITP